MVVRRVTQLLGQSGHVILVIQDRDVRIVNAITGELLRELTIDPDRDLDELR